MSVKKFVVGQHESRVLDQLDRCSQHENTYAVGICADGHLGYSFPVGGVGAYIDHICISGVGFDIACGNMAVKTNLKWSEISNDHASIADQIAKDISFGVGRVNANPIQHSLFDDPAWKIPIATELKQKAEAQLGTVGSGNHYVDVFIDQDDYVWIGVHFGSRGLGHGVASHYLKLAGGKDGLDVPPCFAHVNSDIGIEYLECMRLAGLYAYAGREYVTSFIAKNILKCSIIDEVHNHHNFAWKENHGGTDMWVVRKGSTPAFPNQRGFVGGSMGDVSVILRGIDSPQSKDYLYSTVHGAGRVMSRNEARGKIKWIFNDKAGKKLPTIVTKGKFDDERVRQEIKNKGIELRGGGADECPGVYKRIESVLDLHKDTVQIENILTPKIVVMAGSDIFDPYKD